MDLRCVAYAAGTFVTVGQRGTILTSPDGQTWTLRPSGTLVDLNGVTYQQGLFYVLGDAGVILTSADGNTWQQTSVTPTLLYDLVYANGTYVLVGWERIFTSTDGQTWSPAPEPRPHAYTVAFGAGVFAYGGEDGNVKTSSDGRSWVERLNDICAITKVLYARGHFYAVGCRLRLQNSSSGYVSADGVNWSFIEGLAAVIGPHTGMADGNGTLVVVSYQRTPRQGRIFSSVDGLHWSARHQALDVEALDSVAFGKDTFVAVGEKGTILQSDVVANSSLKLGAAVLPSSRAVQVGTPATAFALIQASGPGTATACSIAPTNAPASTTSFYQQTDAANGPIGTPNTPVDIPGGEFRTFLFGLTPSQPLPATEIQFAYDCTNTSPAPGTPGVNTFLLTSTVDPTPDIIAIVATASNDGILTLRIGVSNAFAVAIANVGAGAAISISVDTGTAILPLALSLCQTDPATGACLSPPAANTTTQIGASATHTFTIFAQASGMIPFDPAANRIYVRFKTQAGVTVGSTSVAVRTE